MKKVLSIDGGGIRGVIPALVLAKIESETGRPISKCFDLIAGTSTGGIIALALNVLGQDDQPQYSAKQLVELYEKHGLEIFPRSFWKGVSSVGGLADEKYSRKGIDAVLNKYFESVAIGAGATNTLVTSYDIQKREPVFIKSWKPEHKNVLAYDAARATSAAPTYFEPVNVKVGNEVRPLIDGGVFINTPSVSAYVEAQRIFPGEEIHLVSLGTGELVREIPYKEAKDWGKVEWLQPLLSCMFDGVSDAADYQMKLLLDKKYYRLQTSLTTASDDMDNASQSNIHALKFEAEKLIRNYRKEIHDICALL